MPTQVVKPSPIDTSPVKMVNHTDVLIIMFCLVCAIAIACWAWGSD